MALPVGATDQGAAKIDQLRTLRPPGAHVVNAASTVLIAWRHGRGRISSATIPAQIPLPTSFPMANYHDRLSEPPADQPRRAGEPVVCPRRARFQGRHSMWWSTTSSRKRFALASSDPTFNAAYA